MAIEIEQIGPERLADYASIPMVCPVRTILEVEPINRGIGGLALHERSVAVPYSKDYDADGNNGPLHWPKRFDMTSWGLWLARVESEIVGAVAIADHCTLWDIRVKANHQRQQIGTALFRTAATWAFSNGCKLLKVETQNVNVPACRFYTKMGCFLGGIDHMAYRQFPALAHEVMLTWYLDLHP